MKKIISVLLFVMLVFSMAACSSNKPDNSLDNPTSTPVPVDDSSSSDSPSPTAVPVDEPSSSQTPAIVEDYYEFGPEEMIIAKTGVTYAQHDSEIDNKVVYELISQGWTGEIWAKATSHMENGENIFTLPEVREQLAEKQYKYVAVTFQLSEGASIGVYSTVPIVDDENFKGELAGTIFTAGSVLSKNANYLDVYLDRFPVYSEGRRINMGDTINANQWYTIVCQLLIDVDTALYGVDSYVNVGMMNGNSAPVYIANVRYYTNDTFKTDYETATTASVEDYYEFGADEMIAYKPSTDVYAKQEGEVFGKTNVYGATFLADWSVEVAAKTTISKQIKSDFTGTEFATWKDVRDNFKAKGYQYAAIEFALSEGSTIRVIGCVPPTAEGANVATTGYTLTAGQPLNWTATCETEEQRSRFHLYANGVEVNIGDTIEAGVWYTAVVELLVDGEQYAQGEDSWASVAFNVGNEKMIYFASVRYYTNDTFTTDYVLQ